MSDPFGILVLVLRLFFVCFIVHWPSSLIQMYMSPERDVYSKIVKHLFKPIRPNPHGVRIVRTLGAYFFTKISFEKVC